LLAILGLPVHLVKHVYVLLLLVYVRLSVYVYLSWHNWTITPWHVMLNRRTILTLK